MFRSIKRFCFMLSLAAVFLAGFHMGNGQMQLSTVSDSFSESMAAVLDPEEAISFLQSHLPEVDMQQIVEAIADLTGLVEKMLS